MAEEKKNHWNFLANLLGAEPKSDDQAPRETAEKSEETPSKPVEEKRAPLPAAAKKRKVETTDTKPKSSGWGSLASEFGLAPADEPELAKGSLEETADAPKSKSPEPSRPREQPARDTSASKPSTASWKSEELPPQLPGFGAVPKPVAEQPVAEQPVAEQPVAEQPKPSTANADQPVESADDSRRDRTRRDRNQVEKEDRPRRRSRPEREPQVDAAERAPEPRQQADQDDQEEAPRRRRKRRRRKSSGRGEETTARETTARESVVREEHVKESIDDDDFDDETTTAFREEAAEDRTTEEDRPRRRRRRRRSSGRDRDRETSPSADSDQSGEVEEVHADTSDSSEDTYERPPRSDRGRRRDRPRDDRGSRSDRDREDRPRKPVAKAVDDALLEDDDDGFEAEIQDDRPGRRKLQYTSWTDTIGHVVDANLANRSKSNGNGGRGRGGRGGGRGRSDRDRKSSGGDRR